MTATVQRHVMVTDLDQTDNEAAHQQGNPTQRKSAAQAKKKTLHTLSGNFSRRSRSAECHLQQQQRAVLDGQVGGGHKCSKQKAQSYLNELLQSKEQQMEKLLERVATLHKYNEQFAEDNQRLQQNLGTLQENYEALHQQITNCEKCQRLSQQLATNFEAQKTLSADVTMLKTLVYRLNVQIEAYQDQLRLANGSGDNNATEFLPQSLKSSTTTSPWHAEALCTHTLTPLLSSYDEMLRDKEDLIQQYRQEFEHFTSELKRTIEENNRLLQQNESLKRDFGGWREERTRLQAQLEVCRTKVEAQARKSDLAKEKLVEVMHCYEQKVQTLVLDLEHIQAAYVRCKTELASLKSVNAQPQDSITQSLQDCKDLLEQLRQQHSKEKHALERSIQELNTRKQYLEKRVDELERENVTLRKDLEVKSTATDELERRVSSLQHTAEVAKQSRDRLKTRLRIALQWAQRLEEGQTNIQNTWDALKRLETIVKHKESQVRGLHARHLQEIDKMEKKLAQKEETIRTILKGKLAGVPSTISNQ